MNQKKKEVMEMKAKKSFGKVVTISIDDYRRCKNRTSCGKSDKGKS